MSEDDFKGNYSNNPLNLLSDCEHRNRPQPRYKLVENHHFAYPEFKYVAYKQCLPGSVAKSKTFRKAIHDTFGATRFVIVTNDHECKAFDVRNCSNAANCEKTQTPLPLKGKPSRSVNSQGKI